MKHIIIAALVLLTIAPAAWANPGINPSQMQMIQKLQNMSPEEQARMMQQMQSHAMKMQSCIGDIDQRTMHDLQVRGEAISSKVEMLCAQGKAKEAERFAMTEGQKIMNDPTVKKLQSCSQDMVKDLPFYDMANPASGKKGGICD